MAGTAAFSKKAVHHTRNTMRILSTQSRFKVLFIAAFAAIFLAGMFLVFLDGFNFLDRMGGIGLMIIGKLFSMFFLSMGIMLAVSSIVSSYTTIYRSSEVTDLLTRPISLSGIVAYRFLNASSLSSWAFFFIIIPFIGAYAAYEKLSVSFVIWTFLFSIPFIITSCGIGAIFTIITVRCFPRIRLVRIIIVTILCAVIAGSFLVPHNVYRPDEEVKLNLSKLLPGLDLSSNPLLPSYWVAEGIKDLSEGGYIRGFLFLALSINTAIVVLIIIELLGSTIFLEGWRNMSSGSGSLKRSALMFPALGNLLSRAGPDIKAMVMKDIRIFFRDPMQWSQALIFFGLLALYFSNIRSFRYHTLPVEWRNMMAFLNVFSVAAVMCSLGSRFVYPQLSLEGQNFWLIGLSPASMKRILLTKFAMAFLCLAAASTGLMILSCSMLRADSVTLAVSICLALAISLTNAALSTGLGAIYLELRESNPVAIVSGFGGTMNLVLNLIFMLITIIPYGYLFQLRRTGIISAENALAGIVLISAWTIIITALFSALPLYLGIKSLKAREY